MQDKNLHVAGWRGKEKEGVRPRHSPLIAIDTETNKDGSLRLAVSVGQARKAGHSEARPALAIGSNSYQITLKPGKTVTVCEFMSKDDLEDYIRLLEKANNGRIPAHIIFFNAPYDSYYLERIIDDDTRIDTGGRLISVKTYGRTPMYDLTNFVEGSLEKWIVLLDMKSAGIEKVKTGCPACGEKGIGFDNCPECGAHIEWSDAKLMKRCTMDALATWYLGDWLEGYIVDVLDVPMSKTIASVAFRLWEKKFTRQTWVRHRRSRASRVPYTTWVRYDKRLPGFGTTINRFEHMGAYGGRVECIKRSLVGDQQYYVHGYDVHALYLSCMQKYPYPHPKHYIPVYGDWGFSKYFGEYLMMIQATVNIPDQHIPPLPYRDTELGKLIFPVGRFKGVWTSPELEYAVNECGVIIEKIHKYIAYTEQAPYFKNFADFIWRERKRLEKEGNDAGAKMIKKIGNSVEGKFIQRNPAAKSRYIKLDDYKGNDLNMEIFQRDGVQYVRTPDKGWYDARQTMPIISALVCAYGRITLLDMLRQFEDHVCYLDTDGYFVDAPDLVYPSDRLGGLKYEYLGLARFYAPKHYMLEGNELELDDRGRPKKKRKIKGIPDKAIFVEATENGDKYEWEAPRRRDESIRSGYRQNEWRKKSRTASKLDTKRLWDGNKSKPIRLPRK